MPKIALLAIASSLVACGTSLPPAPEVWQCGYAGDPRAFYCVNTETGERKKLDAGDETMRGAQCLSLSDYQTSETWVDAIKEIARKRCN